MPLYLTYFLGICPAQPRKPLNKRALKKKNSLASHCMHQPDLLCLRERYRGAENYLELPGMTRVWPADPQTVCARDGCV